MLRAAQALITAPLSLDGESLGSPSTAAAARTRRRVLSVTPWVPAADAPYAGHQWYFRHLNRLAARFDLTVIAPETARNRRSSYPWEVVLVPQIAEPTTLLREVAALRLQGRGAPVPSFPEDVGPADVVELAWSQTMPHARAFRRCHPAAVISSVQVDRYSATLTWTRLSRLRLRRRCRDWAAHWTIGVQEALHARACDLLVGFKPDDVHWGVRHGARPIVVAPFLEQPSPLRPSGETVLFVGAFDRDENVEGAVWLAQRVWPAVLAQRPTARLMLAGGKPADSVRALASASVIVTGFVPDLRPLYEESACVVAPIFGGGGLRFKVPQALVYGLPLVATEEALTGMDGVPRSALAGVTESPAAFAHAIVSVLADRDAAVAAAAPAAEWARRRYFDDSGTARLLEAYQGDDLPRSDAAGW